MKKKENNLGGVLSYLEKLIKNKEKTDESGYTNNLVKGNINKVTKFIEKPKEAKAKQVIKKKWLLEFRYVFSKKRLYN